MMILLYDFTVLISRNKRTEQSKRQNREDHLALPRNRIDKLAGTMGEEYRARDHLLPDAGVAGGRGDSHGALTSGPVQVNTEPYMSGTPRKSKALMRTKGTLI